MRAAPGVELAEGFDTLFLATDSARAKQIATALGAAIAWGDWLNVLGEGERMKGDLISRRSSGAPARWLHIGDGELVLRSGQGGIGTTEQRLDLGASRVARDFLRHDPPTTREIEQAIDVVEDEIMRLGPRLDAGTCACGDESVCAAAVRRADTAFEPVSSPPTIPPVAA